MASPFDIATEFEHYAQVVRDKMAEQAAAVFNGTYVPEPETQEQKALREEWPEIRGDQGEMICSNCTRRDKYKCHLPDDVKHYCGSWPITERTLEDWSGQGVDVDYLRARLKEGPVV